MLYDGVQLCQKVYFDLVRQLSPAIVPIDPTIAAKPAKVAAILSFFERPDGQLDLPDWTCMALREVLEIDALSVYQRRTRGGTLLGLDVVAGDTIKPLLDARGRTPDPPLPGYQQFLYGVPGGLYTSDQLLYRRENPRADSPYGLSRVEAIVMRVNQALRKQTYDLGRWTDGNVPAGFVTPPLVPGQDPETTWSPDILQAFEDEFNALLAGNDQRRNRVKFLPPGFAYDPTAAPDLLDEFDKFLLNVTVAAFGLTMSELGFVEDVNRSSGESQEDVVYRRAVRPVASFIAALFTHVLRHNADLDPGRRYRFAWQGQGLEEEDRASIAKRYAQLIPIGAASVDDYCAEVGLPKPGIGRYIAGKGAPIWLEGAPKGLVLPAPPAPDGADDDDQGDDDGDADAQRRRVRRFDPSEQRAPQGEPDGGEWVEGRHFAGYTGHANVTTAPGEDREAVRAALAHVLQRPSVTDDEVARLVGAPDGATVRLHQAGTEVHASVFHPTIAHQRRLIFATAAEGPRVFNSAFTLRPSAQGEHRGTRSFATQVAEARRLGVPEIQTIAVRSPADNGYYTWARLGYNGAIEPDVRQQLAPAFRDVVDVHDMVTRPGGLDEWRRHGGNFVGTFATQPESQHSKILHRYVTEQALEHAEDEPRDHGPARRA